jgi:ubiquinone/menaquinone biosynthesis C-methylase UbiE
MRALAHISRPAAPDYRLRVPPPLQAGVALGLLIGLAGVVLFVSAPMAAPVYSLILIVVGVVSGGLGSVLWIITSQNLRERTRRRMVEAVAWRGDEWVLDVGCGNGFLLIEMAKHLTTGHATGIDLWKAEAGAQSSESAWRNAHIEGVQDRIAIHNVDARTLPFANQSFDVVVSALMLHHAGGSGDRDQVVREMVRVLKPGGTLLLYDVQPFIAATTRRLRESGLTSIRRTGRIMLLMVASRSPATSKQVAN